MRLVSNTQQTTGVIPMGLNRLKSVVQDAFATRVTMALRLSSGILKFGGRNKKERMGTVLELNAL